ncbi:MAG: LON peptidase substrate-binding domain-containing protein [Anaerolineae bacterium]|nr:LON peptidase substrate-binding domain-containing protein [Anaerolineae bacterium]
MSEDHWRELPLFPLRTVLFPGMVLPLHIFEERYKLMIQRCIADERPFGVVLIREGQEVGGSAEPYEVGTAAIVAGVSYLEDGRMNIVTIGTERFRLRSLRHDHPYLVGEATPWPLSGADTEAAQALVEPVRALLRQYITLLVQAEGHKIELEEIPSDARTVALLTAITLQVSMVQKQELLSCPDIPRLLRAVRAIMRREQLLLHHIIQTQQDQWEGGYSGYLAKN